MTDRLSVTMDMFERHNLALIFRRVQWRQSNRAEWCKVFRTFWPNKGHICPSSAQNWRTMRYYCTWKSRVADMSQNEVNRASNRLWSAFERLAWIPDAKQDRLWYYNGKASFQVLPNDAATPAPRVLVRERPNWNPQEVPSANPRNDDGRERSDGESAEGTDEEMEVLEAERRALLDRRSWLGQMPPRDMKEYALQLRQEEEESSS